MTFTTTTEGLVITGCTTRIFADSNVIVTWDTNIASMSQVEYGTTTSYGSTTVLNTTLETDHYAMLIRLEPDTTYHYRVKSTVGVGTETVSDDYTFTTQWLVITGCAANGSGGVKAVITWETNKDSTSQVEYGMPPFYGMTTSLDTALETDHSVELSWLASNSTYHYRVKSKIGEDTEAVSADYTFTTADAVMYSVGVTVLPSTNNPFAVNLGGADGAHIGIMYEPLLFTGIDGVIQPALAESWSYDDTSMKWTINLNPAAKFSDGTKVKASDVKFTMEKCISLELYQTDDLATALKQENGEPAADAITIIDDTTLTMETETFTATFMRYLGNVVIVPESIWGSMSDEEILAYENPRPVGSGPFLRREGKDSSWGYFYDANPDYWGGAANIDVFVKIRITAQEDQAMLIESGGVDAITDLLTGTSIPALQENPEIDVFEVTDNTTLMFYPNHRFEPWDQPAFRNAVSLGLDRLNMVNFGASGWAKTPVMLERDGGMSDVISGIEWPNQDLTHAERIDLANAALDAIPNMSQTPARIDGQIPDFTRTYDGNSLEFTLLCSSFTEHHAVAELIKQDFTEMGIDMTIEGMSVSGLVDKIFRQTSESTLDDWEACIWGRSFLPEYDYFANQWGYYDTSNYSKRGIIMGWDTVVAQTIGQKLNALQALPEGDATRGALIAQTQQLWADDLPAIPLYNVITPSAHRNDKFTGWVEDGGIFLSGSVSPMIAPQNLLSIEPIFTDDTLSMSNCTVVIVSDTSVTITWNTDRDATSQVEYGTTTSYGSSSTVSSTLVHAHSVTITGLTPSATYHYKVKSTDAGDVSAESTDQTFNTSGLGRILFSTKINSEASSDVYVVDEDGANLTKLTSTPYFDGHAKWSPDHTKIVFESDDNGSGTNDVCVMNADGSSRVNLTNGMEVVRFSTWSPDGAKIGFVADIDGSHDMLVINANGLNLTRLTNMGSVVSPVWSPDGTKIVFNNMVGGSLGGMYVIDADGSNQTHLTADIDISHSPLWSPDSAKIIFVAGLYGHRDIYTMNADGSDKTNLTNKPAAYGCQSWSPDGTKIVFTDDLGDNYIFVMDADGSNQKRLINDMGSVLYPTWSPDGTKIAFTRHYNDGSTDVYVVNADGSNRVNLSNHEAKDAEPEW